MKKCLFLLLLALILCAQAQAVTFEQIGGEPTPNPQEPGMQADILQALGKVSPAPAQEEQDSQGKILQALGMSGFTPAPVETPRPVTENQVGALLGRVQEDMATAAPDAAVSPTVKPTAKPTAPAAKPAENTSGRLSATAAPKRRRAFDKHTNLERGSSGEEVRDLQLTLIDLGYLAQGEADGSYGEKTAHAVHRFKEMNRLYDNCEDASYCQADSGMQTRLYSYVAREWEELDVALDMPPGSYAQWNTSGDSLSIRVEVTNTSACRTVSAFELYVYVTDAWDEPIWGENKVRSWTSQQTVSPGATVQSDYVTLPDACATYEVHAAVKRVRYSDGTVAETPDSQLEYSCWDIRSD